MSAAPSPAVERIVVAADTTAWREAGFRVDEADVARIGAVDVRLAGAAAGSRIVSCALTGVGSDSFDGLPIVPAAGEGAPADVDGSPQPNGVVRLDHIVAFTPDLDRTVAAGEALGLDLRRVRDESAPAGSPRQAFFRLGELMLEVAQAPPGSPLAPESPARFYGLAFVVEDIDATVASLGEELCGAPRDAVQPGRRIATVRREAGLGLPVALMSPRP